MFARLRAKQPGAPLASLLFYAACRNLCHAYFLVFHGVRVVGAEHVPATGACLLAANHQSFYDPPAIGGVLTTRHLDYIARVGLFSFKPFGWLISALNSIPVRGTAGDKAAITTVVDRLRGGRATLIFPEGSRCDDNLIHPFQRGVLLLVRKADCPVVPVAIDGAFHAWPRRRVLPLPFRARITVRFGPPIAPEQLRGDADASLALLRGRIAELLAQTRGCDVLSVLSDKPSD